MDRASGGAVADIEQFVSVSSQPCFLETGFVVVTEELECHWTLSMIDCYGSGRAKKLAEIMAAVILAGEIGCAAAQCAHEFVRAHETMGKNPPDEST